jgi:hypothetical protein
MPQEVPSQVAVPFEGKGQGLHEPPQEATLELEAQLLPQTWRPALHDQPQLEPLQVVVLSAGPAGHGVQLVPQVLTEPLGWQGSAPPQM